MISTTHLRKHVYFARLLLVLMVIMGVGFLSSTPAFAQNNNFIDLTKPDTTLYPEMSIRFRVFDDSGAFTRNMDISSLHIIENNQIIAPDSLEMLEPGLRLIVAFNEGPRFSGRYATVPHLDKIKSALTTWMQSQPAATPTDFSFVTNAGVMASQLTNPFDWIETIRNYQADFNQLKPGLTSLTTALDLAATASEPNDKTSVIFYITSLPTADEKAGLEDLISRAKIENVRLFIWLIGSQAQETDVLTEPLLRAAEETDGRYLFFFGLQELPALSTYFDPLTRVYKAVYHSKIMSSGDFPISLRISRDETIIESEPITFTLNVLPPNPIFLSPPARVERSWTETKRIKDSILTPDTFPLEIMIEFPDGLKRELVYSRLFVDNKLEDENTSPPFENFEWDISNLSESGTHLVSVSIQDSAGFIVETVELPVELIVQPKPQTGIQKLFSAFSTPTIILFFVITAAGLLLVLLAIRTLRQNRASTKIKSHRLEDPLTQPVMIENEIIHPRSKASNTDQWPHLPGSGLAPARLLLQSAIENEHRYPVEIPVGDMGLTFGSDETKSKVILRSAIVSPLHARISRDNQDQFTLFDEGSGSGTWLNYTPVSHFGAHLEHGDLVQFGTIAYRFELFGSQSRKLKVESMKEEE